MVTEAEIAEDSAWLVQQGLTPEMVNTVVRQGRGMPVYVSRQKVKPDVPVSFKHRQYYRRKGWWLVPPALVPVLSEVEAPDVSLPVSEETLGYIKSPLLPQAPPDLVPKDGADPGRLREFLDTRCLKFPQGRVLNATVREAYLAWHEAAGGTAPLGVKGFHQRLKALGVRFGRTGRARVWQGVRLVGYT